MKKALLVLAASLMMLAPVSAPAAVRVFVGGPYYYGGFYRPYWGPYWGPAYYGYANTGEVKLDTKVKDAGVFINGAFAGTTHDNKTWHPRPRTSTTEIPEAPRPPFAH